MKGISFAQAPVQYAQSMGMDADIAESNQSLNLAEKKLNHKMVAEAKDDGNVAYNQKW